MRDLTPSNPPVVLSTSARLSLGNDAPALSTQEHLRFQLDHALARDAVHAPLDIDSLVRGVRERHLETITLRSAVPDEKSTRRAYLRRPDLGRALSPGSIELLNDRTVTPQDVSSRPESKRSGDAAERPAVEPPQIAIILADGLSALALERHALRLLDELLPIPYSLLPVCIVTNARVAIGDEIGHLLRADLTLLLIGERPGLSSPDSLGCYITLQPRPGRTDAERNCISNIRAEGLSYTEAAHRIAYYIERAFELNTTGIALKDPSPAIRHLAENPPVQDPT